MQRMEELHASGDAREIRTTCGAHTARHLMKPVSKKPMTNYSAYVPYQDAINMENMWYNVLTAAMGRHDSEARTSDITVM